MVKLKVNWTHLAKFQRDDIFKYWNKRNKSKSYSRKLKIIIKINTDHLKNQPFAGKTISKKGFRILIFKNYSLIYFIKDNIIFVSAFWENHQNPEKLQNIFGE